MTDNASSLSRRRLLQTGGALGLAVAAQSVLSGQAHADTGRPATTTPRTTPTTTVTDMGPGLVQFSLMSGVLVGNTYYVGSRNMSPSLVVGLDLATRKVVSQTYLDAGPEPSVQALAADPTGRYLYIGVILKADEGKANLFRWDLTTPETPAVDIGRTEDRDIRSLAVAPDGTVYAVGGLGVQGKPPALWEYNPGTGLVTNLGIPDQNATLARAVAATDTTVFFGAGSILAGGSGASQASLYAYDRATHAFTSVVPKEMVQDPSLRWLTVVGGNLAVGSSGSGSNDSAKFALMDLADLSSYSLVATQANNTTVKCITADADNVYFATDTGLEAYSLSAKTLSPVQFTGPDLGEIWGLDYTDGQLATVSDFGFVAEIDLAAQTCVATDLSTAGAPASPQAGMGIAAGAGYAFVGGNGTIARHSLKTGQVVNVQATGEAKDAVVIDGCLYTGQYDSEGIWQYNPATQQEPRQVAQFPAEQNRPLNTSWDRVNQLLLVAVQDDTQGGGALWTYSPRTGKSASFVNPIDDIQLVRAVANQDGVAYLGGDNANSVSPTGTVVAVDPVTGRERWRLETQQQAGVAAMAIEGRNLYVLARNGMLFVIDLRRRKVVHTADVSSVSSGFAAMVTNRGTVYGVSTTTLFRFHPRTFAVSTVVPAINGVWYSGPHVNADRGLLYTLRGNDLVEIDDRPWH